MKYIKVKDTEACMDTTICLDHSFLVAISDELYEPLKLRLNEIVSNDKYRHKYNEMVSTINRFGGEIVVPDVVLNW